MKSDDLGSNDPKSQNPNYKWHVVLMLWGISFFNYADRQAIFLGFSSTRKGNAADACSIGDVGLLFAWVYGLGAPLAGMIVDRVRRKRAILGSLHAWSLICMATALSRRFRQLLSFRAALGLSETFTTLPPCP
ncbi:MAG: MFS transporter [Terriglobia bacterium]